MPLPGACRCEKLRLMGFPWVILILQIKYTVMERSKARTPDKAARPITALKRVLSENIFLGKLFFL